MLDESKFVLQVCLFESTEMKMALENTVIQSFYLMGVHSCKFNGDRVNQALKAMYYIPVFQVNIKGPNPTIVYAFSDCPFEIKGNYWCSW